MIIHTLRVSALFLSWMSLICGSVVCGVYFFDNAESRSADSVGARGFLIMVGVIGMLVGGAYLAGKYLS